MRLCVRARAPLRLQVRAPVRARACVRLCVRAPVRVYGRLVVESARQRHDPRSPFRPLAPYPLGPFPHLKTLKKLNHRYNKM